METSTHGRLNKYEVAGLALVALIGLMHIAYPFDGDQALFTEGALKISRGAVLYRDFWDIKQPGIFVFYLLGGLVLGFTELGIHAFELIYLLILSGILLVTFRERLENRSLSALIPVLTVGFYYTITGPWHLTQVEALVSLPLYLTLWFSTWSVDNDRKRSALLFFSGLFGGITILFKLLFAPIVVAFWLVLFYELIIRRKQERTPGKIAALLVPLAAGLFVPVGLMVLYFGYNHALAGAGYAAFTYPSRAMATINSPVPDRLVTGLRWFLGNFSPLIALSVVGAYCSLRKRFDPFTLSMVLWLIIGFAVILIQRLSWWEYQYMLLFPPLGVLAVGGIDAIWSGIKKTSVANQQNHRSFTLVFTLALFALFSPSLMSLGLKSYKFTRFHFASGAVRRNAYQDDLSGTYRAARTDLSFLSSPARHPGKIFVCGNPIFYILSGREQAMPSNGWMLELFLPEQWQQFEYELLEFRPRYIFVANEYSSLINEHSPDIAAILGDLYTKVQLNSNGIWYELSADPSPTSATAWRSIHLSAYSCPKKIHPD
jgi:hypothetical protein